MTRTSSGKLFLIGTLARRTGVNIETIRYYERVGVLAPPSRSEGRHRLYDEDYVHRLTFVRRCRELGFSIDDVRALLRLVDAGGADCTSTKDITLRHLDDVRGKIASLKKLEKALKTMADACRPGRQATCPILDALSEAA